jgi:fluoride exporter
MDKIIFIALAGAAGTLARYGTNSALYHLIEKSIFPIGTLAANLLGCLLIGFIEGTFADRMVIRSEYHVAIVVGFLGGYTTFSSFGLETTNMLQDGQFFRAGLNIVLNNVLGIGLVILGYGLSRLRL